MIELLDSKDRPLANLTSDWVGGNNRNLQEVEVPIGGTTVCQGCTIRLVRQALEWGGSYRFQSCADVDIVSASVSLFGIFSTRVKNA